MPSKDALQRLIDGLQTLIREHLALARAELKDDARTMGRDLLVGAAGVPALAAGYLLLMMAIGYLLAVWLPTWAAFGIVAAVNLGAGGAVSLVGLRKVMRQRIGMPRTGEELQRDKAWLSSLKDGSRGGIEGRLVEPIPAPPADVRRAPSVNLAGPARPPTSGAVPAGKAGSTAGATGSLGPRSPEPQRTQPEPGATTPPNGASPVH
ncbi:MAG: phage holin family protein [Myxococcales bacterium]